MGIERRQYERIEISGEVLIYHSKYNLNCYIENISNYGAYLKLENASAFHKIGLGDKVTFKISSGEIVEKEISGQILRLSVDDNIIYLAVYFIEPYFFN